VQVIKICTFFFWHWKAASCRPAMDADQMRNPLDRKEISGMPSDISHHFIYARAFVCLSGQVREWRKHFKEFGKQSVTFQECHWMALSLLLSMPVLSWA
jgi:hypothetical protein